VKTTFSLFWWVFFLFYHALPAQEPENIYLQEIPEVRESGFYHLTFPGDNQQNSVTKLLQDSTGRMWIATKNGLIRYNGKEKIIYLPQADNPNSLGYHVVTELYLDAENSLWIGTENGMYLYRPRTDDFQALPGPLRNAYITQITGDNQGNLWIINHRKNTLYHYRPGSRSVRTMLSFPVKRSSEKPRMIRMLVRQNGQLLIIDGRHGLMDYRPATGQYRPIELLSRNDIRRAPSVLPYFLTRIIPDRNNPDVVWIGTKLGYVIRYNLRTGRQQRLIYNTKLSNRGLICHNMDLYIDDRNNLWITTWFYGTYKVLPGRRRMIHYLPSPNRPHGISNTITTAIYQDKAGYLWFGTEYQGIDILKKNKKFHVFPTYPPKPGHLPAMEYTAIAKDKQNRLWVGSEGAVFRVNPVTLEARKVNHLFPGAYRYFAFYPDSSGRLWAGTENGVYCIDSTGRLLHHFTYDKNNFQSISSNFVGEITPDREGKIWFGTFWWGAVRYDPARQQFLRFMPDSLDPNSLSDGRVYKIFVTPKGRIWLGTKDGLNLFHPETGHFTVFQYDKNDSTGITSSVINDLTYADGHLWISTQGGGLNEYLPEEGRFKAYTVKDGLPDNNIKALLTDDHDNIWLTTTHHIVKFDPRTGKSKIYGASDGLSNRIYVHNMGWQDLTFAEYISFKDDKGYLYFGGTGGLLFFHPDSLPVNTYRAPLRIDKFKVNGHPHPLDQNRIILQPDQNQIEAEFLLMNLIQPDKNRYAWKLEPYDRHWHTGNYLARARYFNLPPGHYKLHYKAANNDGIWTHAPQPLVIRILPHFYQTTGFYILIFIFLMFLTTGFLIYRWYLKKQMERKRKLMRYHWSKLDPGEAERINNRLLEMMQNKNIYLEPDLSLNKLAEIIQVKPNYLSQVINQYHRQNFFEFVNKYRIEEAKRLLRETDLKIEAVAYDSGFNSLSTFNAAFKKITGTTPSQYRKQHRKNPS